MRAALRSLRVRFAAVAFLATYVPVLILLGVSFVTEERVDVEVLDGVTEDQITVDTAPSPLLIPVAILLAPAAAGLAWWLSGRAIRPVEEAVAVQGRLVEEASHELRTPLAVLTTNAQVLLDHPEPTVELLRDGVERSGTAAERMTRTIDALLADARSRSRAITRTPTDLGALARSVVRDLEPVAGARSVGLEVSVEEGPVTAAVDEESVGRALGNLVTNAIEHSPNGSTVTVVVRRAGPTVELVVTDRGPGVAAEDRARIFDRFWTRRPDGTGLGLAVVRQVAEAHGGTISVTSPDEGEPGSDDGPGARFVLQLRATS